MPYWRSFVDADDGALDEPSQQAASGYTIDGRESVSAYDLFNSPQDQFFELDEQIRKLSQKADAVKAAKKADNQDTVESIWDDSSRD